MPGNKHTLSDTGMMRAMSGKGVDFLKRCPTCGQLKTHAFLDWSKSLMMWLSALGLLTFLLYQEASVFNENELRVIAKWGVGAWIGKAVIQVGGRPAVEKVLKLMDKKLPDLAASNRQE